MTFAVLIPISLAMGAIGLAAFLWALNNGQYDDPEGAANRVLLLSDPPNRKQVTTNVVASNANKNGTQDRS